MCFRQKAVTLLPLNKEKKMKKLVFPLALLLLVACGQKSPKAPKAEAAQGAKKAQEERPKGPFAQIEFPEGTDYDFGTYYERVDKTHDFLVHNPGKIPLVINEIETACGCTQVTGPQKPILEGQTDTIHVRYDGNGFTEGYWYKHITVHANTEEGVANLRIHGAYYEYNN